MNGYRWTVRVGLGGVGFLATLVLFVAVTRIFKLLRLALPRDCEAVDPRRPEECSG